MTNLTHLWKVGQPIVYMYKEAPLYEVVKHTGTIKEVYEDHLIVDIPDVSDHCYFLEGFNLDTLYPAYNFKGV